jgi:DNA-binding LytR/AlgR family response regulator
MKVLIFEDEKLTAERLITLLKCYDSSVEILAIIDSVQTGIEWLVKNRSPDLIFMDIRLSDGISFELFEKVNIEVPVIFTTAYDEYAIKAFKVNSVDYLVKPYDFNELKNAIDKLRKIQHSYSLANLNLLIKTPELQYKNRFLIKIGDQYKHISCDEIAYFVAMEGMVDIVTHEKSSYPVDISLDKLERQLNPEMFFRLNRKYIAGFHAVKKIHAYFNGRLKIELQPPVSEAVIVSRDKTAKFKEWMGG